MQQRSLKIEYGKDSGHSILKQHMQRNFSKAIKLFYAWQENTAEVLQDKQYLAPVYERSPLGKENISVDYLPKGLVIASGSSG
jgi:hypothetical protein